MDLLGSHSWEKDFDKNWARDVEETVPERKEKPKDVAHTARHGSKVKTAVDMDCTNEVRRSSFRVRVRVQNVLK